MICIHCGENLKSQSDAFCSEGCFDLAMEEYYDERQLARDIVSAYP